MIPFSWIVRRGATSGPNSLCRPRRVQGITIPILAPLPLHRDARRIADLHPDPAPPRSIGAVDLLGRDALGAKPASVFEDGRAVLGDVFVEQDACPNIAQQTRQRSLAIE